MLVLLEVTPLPAPNAPAMMQPGDVDAELSTFIVIRLYRLLSAMLSTEITTNNMHYLLIHPSISDMYIH